MRFVTLLLVLLLSACSQNSTPRIDLGHPGVRPEPVINLAWWHYRQDFGDVKGWQSRGVSRNRQQVSDGLRELKQAGASTVVWFLLADGGASPDFDALGNITTLDPSFFADYREAIKLAEQHGLSIVWVLMDHLWAKPLSMENGAPIFGHSQIIENPTNHAQFLEHVLDPILKIDSPNIAAWIVINEPEVMLQEGWVSEDHLITFLEATAKRIKLRQPHKPVSIGHVDLEAMIAFQDKHSDIPQDFLNFHHYKSYLPPPIAQLRKRLNNTEKPIYLGEFNLNEDALQRPTNDLAVLSGWVRQLGYAGLWPWAATQEGELRLKDIAAFTAALASPASTPLPDDRAALQLQMAQWRAGVERNRSEIAINTRKLRDTEALLQMEQAELAKELRELENAKAAHRLLVADSSASINKIRWMRWVPFGVESLNLELRNQLQLLDRLPAASQWVGRAQANVDRRSRQVDEQQRWKRTFESRVRGNQYQLRQTETILRNGQIPRQIR